MSVAGMALHLSTRFEIVVMTLQLQNFKIIAEKKGDAVLTM